MTAPQPSPASTVLGMIGILLYLIVGFFYVTSGLVVPVYVLPFLWGVWLAGSVVLIRMWRGRRAWIPLIALAAAALLGLVLFVGGNFFDWTA